MKLTDERIKELLRDLNGGMALFLKREVRELADALTELQELRSQSTWISVTPETMPKSEKVQVWGEFRKRDTPQAVTAYVFPRRGRSGCTFGPVFEGVFPKRVTYYRELPSAPQEGGKQ